MQEGVGNEGLDHRWETYANQEDLVCSFRCQSVSAKELLQEYVAVNDVQGLETVDLPARLRCALCQRCSGMACASVSMPREVWNLLEVF